MKTETLKNVGKTAWEVVKTPINAFREGGSILFSALEKLFTPQVRERKIYQQIRLEEEARRGMTDASRGSHRLLYRLLSIFR